MPRFAYRKAVLPAALCLFGPAHAARAQEVASASQMIFLPNNAAIKFAVRNTAIIGYADKSDFDNKTRPTSPTVSLVDGGNISGFLNVYNKSRVTVSGGNIGGHSVGGIEFYDYGSGRLDAYDSSSVTVSGGTFEILSASDHSTVTVKGGSIGVHQVSGAVYAYDHSTVTVSGGEMMELDAAGYSTLTVTGGRIDNRQTAFNKYGPCLTASDRSVVNLRGGHIAGSLKANDSSTLNLYGTGLNKTVKDANTLSGYSLYTLSGKLSDGTDITGKLLYVKNHSQATVNFVDTSASQNQTVADKSARP